MEIILNLATVVIPSVLTLVGCMINNNTQRAKEQHQIEMQISAVNANYDKSTALIQSQIVELADRVKQHNNLIERMYKVEDRLNITEHEIRELRKDVDDYK